MKATSSFTNITPTNRVIRTVLFHALGAWRITPGFHDLLWNPAFTVPASQLLGGAVRFWHDQLFCKPAHHGGVVAWHQDYSYWTRTQPLAHLTCWIGLDDSNRSEEHTSELQSPCNLVCRLLLEKKKRNK